MKLRILYKWLGFFIIPLLGAVFTYYVVQNSKNKERETQELRFEKIHTRAVNGFSNSMYRFAGLVSSMRSYMNNSENLPDAIAFHRFVQNQFSGLKSKDSIVVSFIDTNHVFRHSFTRYHMDPANLVGTKVSSLRSAEIIEELNRLLTQEDLVLFPPLNLIEGWVGIPLNFRVHREGQTLGYVAPIVDFQSIMQNLYDDPVSREFVFHFMTEDGHDIDRSQIHNGTKVYNTTPDPEYYKNYFKDTTNFRYKNITYFGYNLKIGMARKSSQKLSGITNLIWLGYGIFALFSILISSQILRAHSLNKVLVTKNALIRSRQAEIDNQNKDLVELIATKNTFFSIIGHDLKQPLHSVKGLLYLLQKEKISDPGLRTIVEELNQTTGTTIDLLSNLLRWAMSQTGEINFKPEQIDISGEIKGVLDNLRFELAQKNLSIDSNLPAETFIMADSDMIKTVIRNIVSNAIKFSHLDQTIHVNLKHTEQNSVISIRDHGIGMDAAKVSSLFGLDDKESIEGTRGEKGTGLGLVLCKEFVDKHNGTLEVRSKVGEGTTVEITLPQI